MRRAGHRLFLLLILPLLFLSFAGDKAAAAGNSAGKIILDNQELTMPKGIKLENVNGSVMIPIRVVVESLGFEVLWEQKSKRVTVQQDHKSVELAVGSKTATADGVTLDLNAAPKQTGGTVLVPIRFVSEQFGLKVGWDNSDKIVYLTGGSASIGGDSPAPVPTDTPAATPPTATPPLAGGTDQGAVPGGASPSPTPGSPGTPVGQPLVNGAVFTENKLMIALTGSVKPKVSTADSPHRIIVDFPGAAFAAEFSGSMNGVAGNGSPQGMLDVTGDPSVSEIRYALFSQSPPTVRFVIETAASQPYQLSTDASTGLVTIDLNIQADPPANPTTPGTGKPVVVLDAGHGGSQPGAVSPSGKKEKDFNLAVIRKTGELLSQEGLVEVIYTRTDDITLGLQDRVKIAEAAKANLFVSLHANSLPENHPNRAKVNGSETYYSRSASLPLAEIMHKHLVAGTGFKDNGVKSKSLHVTRESSMPAVLLEAGYLTNPGNEAALYSEALQVNLAREIAAGIKEYMGL
ncbi:N-acetylmuramoyl-L-alanine amidase [Paenibacillus albidus]|uniref:N-acetylmuramoyl-L-alanine amidase family protein n=1 Tax=Paenibacillus albidus TaxID=2041023 RepID=UPI001BE77485|nr:N-acetylmuramoyl-L-alanine amidase family protein [Paenibacillus albidus]MBT2288528.1 N-acetylmuramoyl-L-alanine amidase [Paenibacillus albidus]